MSKHDDTRDIAHAAALIRAGRLVAMPTETVYGLAGNALDPQAVARIFAAKHRPTFDPLIVHIADRDQLDGLVTRVPPPAAALIDRFWPGPLTLVLPRTDRVPDLTTSGLDTVAVRMPDHPLALALIRAAATPLAAPSANPFGRISPTTAQHVRDGLGDAVDFILDGGPCRTGVESTVLALHTDQPTILRPGGLPREAIEAIIGPVTVSDPASTASPRSPGMLDRHYAPRTPLELHQICPPAPSPHAGLLLVAGHGADVSLRRGYAVVECLSESGDLTQAAANLFAALHCLDAANVDRIIAIAAANTGLGPAINDRLRRAAHTTQQHD